METTSVAEHAAELLGALALFAFAYKQIRPRLEAISKGWRDVEGNQPRLLGWVAALVGFGSLEMFSKAYEWSKQIIRLAPQVNSLSVIKMIAAWCIMIGLVLFYVSLGCVAIWMALALDLRREWARKITVLLYGAAGLVSLIQHELLGFVISVLIVVYLVRPAVKMAFSKPIPIPG
ncbi:MAG: hypothetical protein JWN45_839 [Acidobacteriaceae bacterium]|nr:hypothetical protein [Acidobacteriaceae bacterium]